MRALQLVLLLAACSPPETGRPPAREPPADTVGGFSITPPPATLAPGDEIQECWIFPLDVGGPSRVVGGAMLTVGPGMHHGNIVARKKTGEGMRRCPEEMKGAVGVEAFDVANGGAVLFGSSTQIAGEEWQSFPRGMGYRIKDEFEIVARMHYLNASRTTITVAPRYQWFTIAESSLREELAPFAWNLKSFEIPPLTRHTITVDCLLPGPMHLVTAMPHMHRMGVDFSAGFSGGPRNGETFLRSAGYDPDRGVVKQYDPPIDLSVADGAWFSCTWQNDLDKTLVEGIGDNEMCILFGYAYPPKTTFSALASPTSCLAAADPTR